MVHKNVSQTVVADVITPPLVPKAIIRADIQGLRALAVGMVVLSHLWPTRLTGGYVGVDVFFVISGFLITSHLSKELIASSTIQLGRFYARRIRRLLPAALLVLLVSAGAVAIWVPYSAWVSTGREILMSAFYLENWSLAAQSVDYSALNADASVAQHYWSLSVEEQFYIVWPLLLFLLFRLGLRFQTPRTWMTLGLLVVTAGSLGMSIAFTATNASQAYFVTPVRVWEFAIGALVAVSATKLRFSTALRGGLAFIGWIAIVVAGCTFGTETPFPGWTALLPVLGTAAVITAGTGVLRGPLSSALGGRPVLWLGDISYSLYLWHWPLIVVAPFVVGHTLDARNKFLLLALALVAAGLSKVFVEDKGRQWKFLALSSRRTYLAMGAGFIVIGLVVGGLNIGATAKESAALAVQNQQMGGPCHGPLSMPASSRCPDALGPAAVTVMSEANRYYGPEAGCAVNAKLRAPGVKALGLCDYSNGQPNPTTVWLTGDSHAEQWKPAIVALARQKRWKLNYALLGGCAVADVAYVGYIGSVGSVGSVGNVGAADKRNAKAAQECRTAAHSIDKLISSQRPNIVFYSIFARKELVDDGSKRSQIEQYKQGLPVFWKKWTQTGSDVYVLADPPLNGYVRDPNCVNLNPGVPLKCAVARQLAHPLDPLKVAVHAAGDPKIRLLDFTDRFCDAKSCFAVIGNVAVYFDKDHLNAEFSREFAPLLAQEMADAPAE